MLRKIACSDCGPDPVNHQLEYWSIVFDWLSQPIFAPLDGLWRLTAHIFSFLHLPLAKLALPILKTLVWLRLGALTTALDNKDNLRTRALWESATKRGIKLWEFRLNNNPATDIFVAQCGKIVRIFEGLPRPELVGSKALNWMDNKAVMKKKFAAAGIPVARGAGCFTFRKAEKTFNALTKPVIVKPHIGSRSRHTTIHINSIKELRTAFYIAKKLSPIVIVEEELTGSVFRGTVVGGKLIAVIRRDPPIVIGDGRLSVQALIEKENQNPKRNNDVFHAIPIDRDTEVELARQGLALTSIAKRGQVITVSQKISRDFGSTNVDVTDAVHPDNRAMLEAVATTLKDSLVGIDFILTDINRPWRGQRRCGVIECNSVPFVDLHHYPFTGTPRDVAGALLDLVFPICVSPAGKSLI